MRCNGCGADPVAMSKTRDGVYAKIGESSVYWKYYLGEDDGKEYPEYKRVDTPQPNDAIIFLPDSLLHGKLYIGDTLQTINSIGHIGIVITATQKFKVIQGVNSLGWEIVVDHANWYRNKCNDVSKNLSRDTFFFVPPDAINADKSNTTWWRKQ